MRGISPVVAFVLLVAISAISTIGLYFWINTLNTNSTSKPLTNPSTPISVSPLGSKYILVSNLGTNPISTSVLRTNDPSVSVKCNSNEIYPGSQVVCELVGTPSTPNSTIAVYGQKTGVAIVRFGVTEGVHVNIPSWYFGNLPYRQPIYLHGNGQTNYQIPLLINTSNVGSHFNWSDMGIRFTYLAANKETEIPYWIEYWEPTSKQAKIWIKVPRISANTTVFMYYGNDSVYSKSNVSSVFLDVIPGLVADWDGSTNLTGMPDLSGNNNFCRFSPIRFGNTNFPSFEAVVDPQNSQAVGVLGTDGRYIYGKSWSSYDYNDNIVTKIGTGFYNTTLGDDYGDIGSVSGSLSGFYLGGYFYNGFTSNGSNLQRINLTTGVLSYVKLGAPLMDRGTGRNLTSSSSSLLVTTDGRYVYDLAYGRNGTVYSGWALKIFDPYNNWKLVKYIKWGTSSYYTDGVIADGNYIYAIKWTGVITAFNWNGTNVSSWETDQGTTRVINGQYDWVNNKIWMGGLGNLKVSSPNSAPYDYLYRWQGHADEVSGIYGHALKFDGFDDYMDCGDGNDLNSFPDGLTLEIVGKQTSYTNGLDSWALDKDYTGYRLWGTDQLKFGVRSPTQGWTLVGNVKPKLNEWYHVFGVVDVNSTSYPNNSTLYLYINGKLNATVVSKYKYSFGYYPTHVILGKHSTQSRYWPGVLDEVRIYNRPLTAEEISEITNNRVYATPYYPGYALIRKMSPIEPSVQFGQEESPLYKQKITLHGDGQTNYQVELELNSSNVGSHFNWNHEGLKFTYLSGNVEVNIPYWIESWNSTNKEALVWIKVPLIASNTTVYMYYGSDLTDESNGDAVFLFFDDFNGKTLDPNKWDNSTYRSSYPAPYNLTNGSLWMWGEWGGCCGGGCVYNHINTRVSFTPPFAVESRFMVYNTSGNPLPGCCNICYHTILGNRDVIGVSSDGAGYAFRINTSSTDGKFYFPDVDKWHIVTEVFLPTKLEVSTDYGLNMSYSNGQNVTSGPIGLAGDTDSSTIFDIVDWIAVRKYSPDKITYSFGPEVIAS